MPETNFTFRVDRELKKAFAEAARAKNWPGSQLLRDFMRDYVEQAEHDAWFRVEVEQSLKEADERRVDSSRRSRPDVEDSPCGIDQEGQA